MLDNADDFIIFNLLSPVFIASGLLIGSIVFTAFVFGGGYMVTADTDVPMAGLLSYAALSVFYFWPELVLES